MLSVELPWWARRTTCPDERAAGLFAERSRRDRRSVDSFLTLRESRRSHYACSTIAKTRWRSHSGSKHNEREEGSLSGLRRTRITHWRAGNARLRRHDSLDLATDWREPDASSSIAKFSHRRKYRGVDSLTTPGIMTHATIPVAQRSHSVLRFVVDYPSEWKASRFATGLARALAAI